MTRRRPFALAQTGFDHCPSMTLAPGGLSVQTTLPVCLLTATKLGASGLGRAQGSWETSLPLPVTANTRSPTTSGELAASWQGKTFSSLIMSSFQWNLALPGFLGSPLTSAQTNSQRLLT